MGRSGGNVRGKSGCMLGSPFRNTGLLRLIQRQRMQVAGATRSQFENSKNATGADNQQGSPRDPSTTERQASLWDGETV